MKEVFKEELTEEFKEELFQHKNSHKFSSDALLLAQFVPLEKTRKFAELGTGCGIIALELLKKNKTCQAIALDFNADLLESARINAKKYACEDRISFVQQDIVEILERANPHLLSFKHSCELVVTNPPWYLESQGKLPSEDMKKKALFGNKDTYKDFFKAARFFLKEKGLLAFITIPQRTEDIFTALKKERFVVKKMQYVHKDMQSQAIFLMILAQYKGRLTSSHISDLIVESPLFLHK